MLLDCIFCFVRDSKKEGQQFPPKKQEQVFMQSGSSVGQQEIINSFIGEGFAIIVATIVSAISNSPENSVNLFLVSQTAM